MSMTGSHVGILRGEKKMNIRLTLAERDKVAPDNQRSNLQNSMGSILSRRRKDFPEAFQHDSMLSSKTCGGPIVDLSGKIVGINIARAGRVSSLAIAGLQGPGDRRKAKDRGSRSRGRQQRRN